MNGHKFVMSFKGWPLLFSSTIRQTNDVSVLTQRPLEALFLVRIQAGRPAWILSEQRVTNEYVKRRNQTADPNPGGMAAALVSRRPKRSVYVSNCASH
jgi:hypothetical protein